MNTTTFTLMQRLQRLDAALELEQQKERSDILRVLFLKLQRRRLALNLRKRMTKPVMIRA